MSDKVPEFWGRPSEYSPGTDFLGTPPDHLKLVEKRPLSPHVFDIDGKSFHYKQPWGAVTSILNRATGVSLSVGFTGASYIALTGDLPGMLLALNTHYPVATVPIKFIVAFPILYHYLGGMRHIIWDSYKLGNQTDRTCLLETPKVEQSSKVLLAASVGLTALVALL